MSEVLVVVDHADGEVKKPTYELLTIAKRLGEPAAVFFGSPDKGDAVAEKVKKYGAAKVYVIDDAPIKGFLVAPKAEALQQLAEQASPAAMRIHVARAAGCETARSPQSAIVTSSSRRIRSRHAVTPASPIAPSPYRNARPISTPLAPRTATEASLRSSAPSPRNSPWPSRSGWTRYPRFNWDAA